MPLASRLRYPTSRLTKTLSLFLALLLFGLLALFGICAWIVYRIVTPPVSPTSLRVEMLMGHPSSVSYRLSNGNTRDGWFFPGLRGAPTVILCHGYASQRADVLTLVTVLQEHQFNVFLFDFSGHGTSPGHSSLGYGETDELKAVLAALSARDDIDSTRFGAWGMDIGAYAILATAERDARIRALAVESPFNSPLDYLGFQVRRSGFGNLPLFLRVCRLEFRLSNSFYRNVPPISDGINRLAGVPKLFLQARDLPDLAQETTDLFRISPQPRQQLVESTDYTDLGEEEKRAYENAVTTFFLQVLPPIPRSAP